MVQKDNKEKLQFFSCSATEYHPVFVVRFRTDVKNM
jgi:hypothetical protein